MKQKKNKKKTNKQKKNCLMPNKTYKLYVTYLLITVNKI